MSVFWVVLWAPCSFCSGCSSPTCGAANLTASHQPVVVHYCQTEVTADYLSCTAGRCRCQHPLNHATDSACNQIAEAQARHWECAKPGGSDRSQYIRTGSTSRECGSIRAGQQIWPNFSNWSELTVATKQCAQSVYHSPPTV